MLTIDNTCMPGKKNIAILICLLNIHVQSLNVKIDNTIEIYKTSHLRLTLLGIHLWIIYFHMQYKRINNFLGSLARWIGT